MTDHHLFLCGKIMIFCHLDMGAGGPYGGVCSQLRRVEFMAKAAAAERSSFQDMQLLGWVGNTFV